MKYCEDYAALLDAFIDGELSPEDMARVQAHLEDCPGCRAYVDQSLAIRAAFPHVEDTEVPEGFAQSVMAAVQAHPRSVPKPRKTPWLKVLAPLAACVALVVLIGPMRSARQKACSTSAQARTTESAAPAAAPAMDNAKEESEAETPYTYDTAALPEEPAAQADPPAESAPESNTIQAAAEDKSAAKTDDAYFASLTLPSQAASLLADYEPVQENGADRRYRLTREEYDALSARLDPDWEYVEVLYGSHADSNTAIVVLLLDP